MLWRRLPEHRVKRGHNRHAQLSYEIQYECSRYPAKDAVLVLEARKLDLVHVKELGCQPVVPAPFLTYLEVHTLRVGVAAG